ncbi:hypothetical protein G6F16_012509 [Rhizopus arrhizus]|uniref:Uncharacterized protein n=1 Tax=Rhizopus oryzae TaxID=64495 RepID=A0A9P6WXF5_RHIOR|nr:hypothetical protein G6F22_015297 [Rhizopus arrhizus]KAG0778471.1 hypothetical protein G6F21_012970 [Rhizopus arrhizus]KAG0803933.1 hypothetical protein G6F20_013096 [Rhizopus arrhizus]KAG0815713.1 hypothetical protein G6F19_012973 [Rhizopus arrhizus]KAG0816661.1 hypothetical protein G6F18_012979 [Rhizopus arrhizus]
MISYCSTTQDTEIMSLDCQSTRESYLNDPCGGGCSSTCSVHAEGPGKIVENTQQELGCRMSTVPSKSTGVDLVAHSVTDKEWTADAEPLIKPRISIYVDASLTGWGISWPEIQTSGYWSLEEQSESINVRELKTILFALLLHAKKVRPLNHTTFYRQYHSAQLCEKFRGNIISRLARHRRRNPKIMQHFPPRSPLSPYTGDNGPSSRQAEQTGSSVVRMVTTEEMVSSDTAEMGCQQVEDRRLCRSPQCETEDTVADKTGAQNLKSTLYLRHMSATFVVYTI